MFQSFYADIYRGKEAYYTGEYEWTITDLPLILKIEIHIPQ